MRAKTRQLCRAPVLSPNSLVFSSEDKITVEISLSPSTADAGRAVIDILFIVDKDVPMPTPGAWEVGLTAICNCDELHACSARATLPVIPDSPTQLKAAGEIDVIPGCQCQQVVATLVPTSWFCREVMGWSGPCFAVAFDGTPP